MAYRCFLKFNVQDLEAGKLQQRKMQGKQAKWNKNTSTFLTNFTVCSKILTTASHHENLSRKENGYDLCTN
jgi:hypothetical protein